MHWTSESITFKSETPSVTQVGAQRMAVSSHEALGTLGVVTDADVPTVGSPLSMSVRQSSWSTTVDACTLHSISISNRAHKSHI